MFVIASGLCIFVAGLEALSESFVRGVKFQDEPAQSNDAHSNGGLNGTAKAGAAGGSKRGKSKAAL